MKEKKIETRSILGEHIYKILHIDFIPLLQAFLLPDSTVDEVEISVPIEVISVGIDEPDDVFDFYIIFIDEAAVDGISDEYLFPWPSVQ